ncbi:hypothetical protein COBT_002156 [Conglomerata obtusa]
MVNFSNNVIRIVIIILCAALCVLIKNWARNRRIKNLIKDLRVYPIEKERAIELIEKQDDKVSYFSELVLKYAKINFEEEIRKSPIFATVLFEELNKYLLINNQLIKAQNLDLIKIIIKDESKELLFYDIVKNFFICLILDINFDYKKYREPLFELCGYKEIKDINNKKKDHGIVLLKGMVESEYIHMLGLTV